MKRFKNILTVIGDPSQAGTSLSYALDLAQRNNAKLCIISVVEDGRPIRIGGKDSLSELDQLLVEQRYGQIESMLTSAEGDSSTVPISVLSGTPFVEIVKQVISDGVDIVIVPAGGIDGPVRSLFFGSTAMHLIRKCPCPVWIVREQPFPGLSKILVGLAAVHSEEDTTRNNLDRKLLEMASSLSDRHSAEWDIVHAWHIPGEMALTSPKLGLSRDEIKELNEEEARNASARVQRLLDQINLVKQPSGIHIEKGYPETVVPQLAHSIKADLTVMGSVGTVGIPGLLLGTTAEQILNQLEGSVLTVKPEGFECPVKF
jgi:nucleotide-binding universal stress UspA family protein